MTRPALMFAPLVLAVLAGCDRSAPPPPQPADSASPEAVAEADTAPEPSGAVPSVPASTMTDASAGGSGGASIPLALRGRWGLVPADCTSTRGDAKGLLVIGPDTLRFYESTARAGTVSDESPTRLRASFAFSGEGSVWTRDMQLEASDDGRTLTRRDYGGDAGPEPLAYTRC